MRGTDDYLKKRLTKHLENNDITERDERTYTYTHKKKKCPVFGNMLEVRFAWVERVKLYLTIAAVTLPASTSLRSSSAIRREPRIAKHAIPVRPRKIAR